MRLACGAGRVAEPVPVGELVRVAGRGAGSGAPGSCAGSGGWAWTGSPRRCAASCPGGAGSGRALGIIRAVFAALADPAGVTAHRPGALERAHLALGDWRDIRVRLADTETRMHAVLEELGLAGLVTTIGGLTVTGAAAILAETGDPARFATARALDGHAGLCPRDNSSGAAQGKTSISGRGRPALRLAAWRAVWAAMPNNPVMAARVHSPDHPPGQPAGPPAGPHGLRRSPAALDPCRRHSAGDPGSRHCGRRHAIAAGRLNHAT